MTDVADRQASLEASLKAEVVRMYQSGCDRHLSRAFVFWKRATQDAAEAYGVKAVMMTASKPAAN